jgi:hypothetical protein
VIKIMAQMAKRTNPAIAEPTITPMSPPLLRPPVEKEGARDGEDVGDVAVGTVEEDVRDSEDDVGDDVSEVDGIADVDDVGDEDDEDDDVAGVEDVAGVAVGGDKVVDVGAVAVGLGLLVDAGDVEPPNVNRVPSGI